MQGFCPLCSKNGIEAKIKAFQINFNEAVFVCSTDECTWPVGCQELKFINRSVEEDWSKCGEKVAYANLNNCSQVGNTVPDQLSVLTEDNCCIFEEDSTTLSKPCDLSLDTNIDSESNLALQPVDSVPINDKAGVSPTNNNKSSDTPIVVYTKPANIGNVTLIVNGISTSLSNNSVPVKISSISSNNLSRLTVKTSSISSNNLSTLTVKTSDTNSNNLPRLSKVSKDLSVSPKLLNRARRRALPFKKFNMNDLQKAKSTNVDKETNINIVARNAESSKEKENKTLNNAQNFVNLDFIETNRNAVARNTESSKEKENKTLNNAQNFVDLDSNSSSNNESDNSETPKNAEADFNLDEFLNGLCNDISGKPEAENEDEYDWIDSLVF